MSTNFKGGYAATGKGFSNFGKGKDPFLERKGSFPGKERILSQERKGSFPFPGKE